MSLSEPRQDFESRGPSRTALDARRAAKARRAALAKRRFDVLLGVVIGLIVFLLAPGVATAALYAVLVLIALGARAAIAGRRQRRSRRRPRTR